jgi:hypothetical protein
MNYYQILGSLNDQLETNLKQYFSLARDTSMLNSRTLNDVVEKINAITKVYVKQIEKGKILLKSS